MQVVVALFRAGGSIVGRDDLVASCWDGRIVGDDAINRVIGRIRRLEQTLGCRAFAVETVTRVGYRMTRLAEPAVKSRTTGAPEADPPVDAPVDAPVESPVDTPPVDTPPVDTLGHWSRRALVRSAAALATAVGIPALLSLGYRTNWLDMGRHRPNAAARRFYDEGMRAQYHSLIATSEFAEGYFRRAAAADPGWADAWGSLAMSYRHMLDGETNVAQWRLVAQTRSAARRALELDPNNAEALVALTLIRSPFRRWRQAEAEYRALLDRFPTPSCFAGILDGFCATSAATKRPWR